MVESKSLSEGLTRARAAMAEGLLDRYGLAKSLSESDRAVQQSWGPAMRR